MEEGAQSLVGRVIAGKLRLVRKLGEGGMGSVYEAVHEQLGSRVAVKILHSHAASDSEMVRRFNREARAAGYRTRLFDE